MKKKVIRVPSVKELIRAGGFKDLERLFWSYEPQIKQRKRKKQSKILWLLLLLFFLIKQAIFGGILGVLKPWISWIWNTFWPLILGFGAILIKKLIKPIKKTFGKLKKIKPPRINFNSPKVPQINLQKVPKTLNISHKLFIIPPLAFASVPVVNHFLPPLSFVKDVKVELPELKFPFPSPVTWALNPSPLEKEVFLPEHLTLHPKLETDTLEWRKKLEEKEKAFKEHTKESLGLNISDTELAEQYGGNTEALKAIALENSQKALEEDRKRVLKNENFEYNFNKAIQEASSRYASSKPLEAEKSLREANFLMASVNTSLNSEWNTRLRENSFSVVSEESVQKIKARGDQILEKALQGSKGLAVTLFGQEVLTKEEKQFLSLYFPLKYQEAEKAVSEAKWKEMWGALESFSLTKFPNSPIQYIAFTIGVALTASTVIKMAPKLVALGTKIAANVAKTAQGIALTVGRTVAEKVMTRGFGLGVRGGTQFFRVHGAHFAKTAASRFAADAVGRATSTAASAAAQAASSAEKIARTVAAADRATKAAQAAKAATAGVKAALKEALSKTSGTMSTEGVLKAAAAAKEAAKVASKAAAEVADEGIKAIAKMANKASKEAAKAAAKATAKATKEAAKAAAQAARAAASTAQAATSTAAKEALSKSGGILGRMGTFLRKTPTGLKTMFSNFANKKGVRSIVKLVGLTGLGASVITPLVLMQKKGNEITQQPIDPSDPTEENPDEKTAIIKRKNIIKVGLATLAIFVATSLPFYLWRRRNNYSRRISG